MDKISNYDRHNLSGKIIFILLLGIYMFPEQIKFFSLLFLIVFTSISFCLRKEIKFTITAFIWMLYLVLGMFIGFLYGSEFSNMLEFVVSIIMALIIYAFDYTRVEREKQINSLYYFTWIVLFGCFFQLIFPVQLHKFNLWHLGSEKFFYFDEFFRGGRIVGFSFQTGITAFYLTVMLSIAFFRFLGEHKSKSKKYLYLLLSIVDYVFVFFTGKRIFSILIPVIIIFMLLLKYKRHKGKIFLLIVFMCFMALILLNTDAGQSMIEKSTGNSWSSGRVDINEIMIKSFLQRPIFGNGLSSTLYILKEYRNGHNIYIQILTETGLIGFFLLIFMFIGEIKNSLFHFKMVQTKSTSFSFVLASFFNICLYFGWGFTGNPLYDVYPYVVYMIFYAYLLKSRSIGDCDYDKI